LKVTATKLLRSQADALLRIVSGHVLASEPFVCEDRYVTSRTEDIAAVVHEPSGSSFSLYYEEASQHLGRRFPAGFTINHSPGVQAFDEEVKVPGWDDVLARFRLWLDLLARELGRADVVAPTSLPVTPQSRYAPVWALLHPEVSAIAGPRFANGQLADAVEASLKHVNELLQRRCRNLTGEDLDGSKLMKRLFSVDKPVLMFGDLSTQTGRSMQIGYMELFSGAMTGIRNPKAHANIQIDERRALHLLAVASLLRFKIDEATPVS